MPDWSAVIAHIVAATGQPFRLARIRSGGGCINRTVVLEGEGQLYFVKYNDASLLEMFSAEAEGLAALRETRTIRVPVPICSSANTEIAFLVLEYLPLEPAGTQAQERLGAALARLHRITQPHFGWHRTNTIGTIPQPNRPTADWIDFLREQRLGHQLRLAAKNGHRRLVAKGERLLANLDRFFGGYAVQPSLLHGDLWSRNVAQVGSEPVVFDPAIYFGDREADLAMTELFGGFTEEFYGAYCAAWPLASGYEVRRTLYNLYHILNHVNLFGSSYLGQADDMLDYLLAELD